MTITIQAALTRCIEHREIFHDEMLHLFRAIMRGEVSDIDLAALTVALRTKKETVGEITAAAQAMREFSARVDIPDPASLLDVVGTGGDGAHTFNISTASIFVAAACGVRCAKHGGKSVSSSSGSADVLQTLGANIMLSPAAVAQCVSETGIGFMYAPMHHLAMKHAAAVRKQLGIRTIFNILGPLTNPAGAQRILMGVFHPDLVGIQVRVLQRLGARRAMVVWGRDNLDEASLGAATMVGELRDGEIFEYDIHPEDFGLPMMATRRFAVSNAAESAAFIQDILSGKDNEGSNIVMLNSALALYVADKVSSIQDGLTLARTAIASGAAYARLQQFIETTHRLSQA